VHFQNFLVLYSVLICRQLALKFSLIFRIVFYSISSFSSNGFAPMFSFIFSILKLFQMDDQQRRSTAWCCRRSHAPIGTSVDDLESCYTSPGELGFIGLYQNRAGDSTQWSLGVHPGSKFGRDLFWSCATGEHVLSVWGFHLLLRRGQLGLQESQIVTTYSKRLLTYTAPNKIPSRLFIYLTEAKQDPSLRLVCWHVQNPLSRQHGWLRKWSEMGFLCLRIAISYFQTSRHNQKISQLTMHECRKYA